MIPFLEEDVGTEASSNYQRSLWPECHPLCFAQTWSLSLTGPHWPQVPLLAQESGLPTWPHAALSEFLCLSPQVFCWFYFRSEAWAAPSVKAGGVACSHGSSQAGPQPLLMGSRLTESLSPKAARLSPHPRQLTPSWPQSTASTASCHLLSLWDSQAVFPSARMSRPSMVWHALRTCTWVSRASCDIEVTDCCMALHWTLVCGVHVSKGAGKV